MLGRIFRRLYKYKYLKIKARQDRYGKFRQCIDLIYSTIDKIVSKFRKRVIFKSWKKVDRKKSDFSFNKAYASFHPKSSQHFICSNAKDSSNYSSFKPCNKSRRKRKHRKRWRSTMSSVNNFEFKNSSPIKIVDKYDSNMSDQSFDTVSSKFKFKKYQRSKLFDVIK